MIAFNGLATCFYSLLCRDLCRGMFAMSRSHGRGGTTCCCRSALWRTLIGRCDAVKGLYSLMSRTCGRGGASGGPIWDRIGSSSCSVWFRHPSFLPAFAGSTSRSSASSSSQYPAFRVYHWVSFCFFESNGWSRPVDASPAPPDPSESFSAVPTFDFATFAGGLFLLWLFWCEVTLACRRLLFSPKIGKSVLLFRRSRNLWLRSRFFLTFLSQ